VSGPLEVSRVEPESPAALAGLKAGERVLQINGQPVQGLISASPLLVSNPAACKLLVAQDQQKRTVTVRLQTFQQMIRHKTGLTLSDTVAQGPAEGLVIDDIEPDSPADRAKLQRGFVLGAVEGQRAASLKTIGAMLASLKKGDTVALTVVVPRRLNAAFVEFRQATVEIPVR
jgi:S1-C subfamily serine protease